MSDMIDDDEDLIGPLPGAAARARRKEKETVLDNMIKTKRMGNAGGNILVDDMMAGVTVSWLSQVFAIDPKTIKAKLADCPPLHRRKAGYVYSLPIACRYLIPPAISAEQYIKTMKPSDLPASFQQSFWDAALKRQKWEENAGQLWRTDRVREVLGSTFQMIKFTIQLWSDTLERQTGLEDPQRELLNRLTDELQLEIYNALVAKAKKTKTKPQSGELSEMLGVREEDIADLI